MKKNKHKGVGVGGAGGAGGAEGAEMTGAQTQGARRPQEET